MGSGSRPPSIFQLQLPTSGHAVNDAGLHTKANSASWNFHSTKTSAAKSAKRVHKSHAVAPTHAADKLGPHHTAAAVAAGPAASGSAAAARKGKAKLTGSGDGLHHGAASYRGSIAQQLGLMSAIPHSRLRSKVYPTLFCSKKVTSI